MRFRLSFAPFLASIILAAAIPAGAQVRPAATAGGWPLVVGAGFSDYNVDFGAGRREDGGAIWADWTFRHIPNKLQGLGLDVSARDISFDAPAVLPNMRYDTAEGGAIYHILRPRRIRPYAKLLAGYGSIDFPPYPNYAHDTRAFYAFGGGADIHAWGHLWVRADYEYQIWQNLFGSPRALTPNGFTFGPELDFGGNGAR